MKYSIVVPCYNEQENIPLILDKFSQSLLPEMEVILVNNGSTDQSAKVMDTLLPRYPFAKTVLVPVNQGYGYGILQGLKEAQGDYIGWTHADLQTDPADVAKAFTLIAQYPEKSVFVKGNRKGRPFSDNIFTWGMGIFESVFMGTPMWDINAQPNIFRRSFFSEWKTPPYDFALDLYAVYLAKRKGLALRRFPVRFSQRLHGESKWNTGLQSKVKFIKRTISFSLKLKKEGIR